MAQFFKCSVCTSFYVLSTLEGRGGAVRVGVGPVVANQSIEFTTKSGAQCQLLQEAQAQGAWSLRPCSQTPSLDFSLANLSLLCFLVSSLSDLSGSSVIPGLHLSWSWPGEDVAAVCAVGLGNGFGPYGWF